MITRNGRVPLGEGEREMAKTKGRAVKQSLSPTVNTQTVNGGTKLVTASVLAQEAPSVPPWWPRPSVR